jgi:hypothetical protein
MRYAIWNKKDPIITPIGEVLTAEQWIQRYPVAGLSSITVVCSAGEINGAFFGTLGQMTNMYEDMGCDFSACATAEEKLAAIEAFDKARNEASAAAMNEDPTAASLASIAASLEYQNMMTLEDTEA